MFGRQKKYARIRPNQLFLHGTERYEKGQVYRVPIADARYFERAGWLESSSVHTQHDVTDLEIDDVRVELRTEIK